jgi:uncharacterized protein (DUF58 family)
MRTSLLAGLTTRGTSFLAAGAAAALAGYFIGERALFCVGIALVALPLLAATAARRGQLHISISRVIRPPRAPAGHTALVTLRLVNSARVSTGLLLAEDTVPYALGTRPRYVLDKIERYGFRELTYPLRSDVRGKFEIGPLQLRVADSFGLVEVTRSVSGRTTFFVTPRVVPLSRTVISRSWAGEGDGRARLTSTAGEDDVVPRAYRDGDELRRVHWRSTARYGELMVRREEQRFRNRATVFLDSRSSAHMGSGAASSFELAISAAASVGAHIAEQGLTGHFLTDGGVVGTGPFFEDRLLDTLAVIRPSSRRSLNSAFEQLRMSSAGVIIAVMGQVSVAEAQQLAACRSEGSQGIALLLDVKTWSDGARAADRAAQQPGSENGASRNGASENGIELASIGDETTHAGAGRNGASVNGASHNAVGRNGAGQNGAGADSTSDEGPAAREIGGNGPTVTTTGGTTTGGTTTGGAMTGGTAVGGTDTGRRKATRRRPAADAEAAAAVLRSAGWQVTIIDASTPLAAAWRRLPRTNELIPAIADRAVAPRSVAAPEGADEGGTESNGGEPA